MLKKSKDQLNQEREKLLRHFHHSDEGICIFSADHKKIYANTHFIQYVNTILDEPTFDVDHIFQAPEFKEAEFFLQKKHTGQSSGQIDSDLARKNCQKRETFRCEVTYFLRQQLRNYFEQRHLGRKKQAAETRDDQ